MRFTYQKGSLRFRSRDTLLEIRIWEICCVLGGVLLFGILQVKSLQAPESNGYIKRPGYGAVAVNHQVQVKGLEEGEQVGLTVSARPREYTDQERQEKLDTLLERIGPTVLNGNTSFQMVTQDLKLISKDPETGFKITWSSEDPELLDSFGHVSGELQSQLPEGGKTLFLQAAVSAGREQSQTYELSVTVLPLPLSEEEQRKEELMTAIKDREEAARTEEGFWLPADSAGNTLSYSQSGGQDHALLLALGPFVVILLRVRDSEEKKKKRKARENRLLYEYSGLVSKLQIFLGAGMTVRSAWERMVLDYQSGLDAGRMTENPAYEEMSQTFYQIKSGVPESRAYQDFGRRCMLQPYLKLGSLLEQNRKNGMKNLSQQLQLEVVEAFEQRKNLARRQGEEAATKLLAPLFLMLGIVMVIVVVPAFLTFY